MKKLAISFLFISYWTHQCLGNTLPESFKTLQTSDILQAPNTLQTPESLEISDSLQEEAHLEILNILNEIKLKKISMEAFNLKIKKIEENTLLNSTDLFLLEKETGWRPQKSYEVTNKTIPIELKKNEKEPLINSNFQNQNFWNLSNSKLWGGISILALGALYLHQTKEQWVIKISSPF